MGRLENELIELLNIYREYIKKEEESDQRIMKILDEHIKKTNEFMSKYKKK